MMHDVNPVRLACKTFFYNHLCKLQHFPFSLYSIRSLMARIDKANLDPVGFLF